MRTGDAPDFRVEVRRIRVLVIAGEREAAIVEEVAQDLEALRRAAPAGLRPR